MATTNIAICKSSSLENPSQCFTNHPRNGVTKCCGILVGSESDTWSTTLSVDVSGHHTFSAPPKHTRTHTHTHTRARARTHARTHAHAHTHTHTQSPPPHHHNTTKTNPTPTQPHGVKGNWRHVHSTHRIVASALTRRKNTNGEGCTICKAQTESIRRLIWTCDISVQRCRLMYICPLDSLIAVMLTHVYTQPLKCNTACDHTPIIGLLYNSLSLSLSLSLCL